MEINETVRSRLEAQEGLIRRSQLLRGGVSPSAIRWRIGLGWRVVPPGVIAAFAGQLTTRQRLIAGQLSAGPEAIVAGLTAAAWHGVLAAQSDPWAYLQVPAHQRARRHGFVIVVRPARPDPGSWWREPVRVATPARAAVDAARQAPIGERSRAIALEAVQRRIVRVDDLRQEVEAGPIRGSAWVRRAVVEAESGAWPIPESDLLVVLRCSQVLPEVVASPPLFSPDGLRLPTPDVWIDDVGLAVQVHSCSLPRRGSGLGGNGDGRWQAHRAGRGRVGGHPFPAGHPPRRVPAQGGTDVPRATGKAPPVGGAGPPVAWCWDARDENG